MSRITFSCVNFYTKARVGKIFECGEYPDKNFSLNEQEMQNAISAFSPVPIDLEHTPTILNGNLGMLESVFNVGKELFGKVTIPDWLSNLLGNEPVNVSATWDRVNKTLVGLSLVLQGRVTDAQLQAAFGNTGNMNETAIADGVVEKLKAFFAKSTPTPPTTPPISSPESKDSEEVNALKRQLAEFKLQGIKERAKSFSENPKLLPCERAFFCELYEMLAVCDEVSVATFSSGVKAKSRVEFLSDYVSNRPALPVASDMQEGDRVINSGTPNPDRIKELMGMTNLGQVVMRGSK